MAKIVQNQVPLIPVWVISQLSISIRRDSKGLQPCGEGWGGGRTTTPKNCRSAVHLWILHQRARMKGRDRVTTAPAIIHKFNTGSDQICDDDMVSSLLWSTARPDADTWPSRRGALFNHLELKPSAFDKQRRQDAQTLSALRSEPDLIFHNRSPRRNYYMQHLLQSWEHISKRRINRALLICKVLEKKTKWNSKQKHVCSTSCHITESVLHIWE